MSQLQFVRVSKESIVKFIHNAKYRIVYAKPAFYRWEITEMLATVKKNNISQCEVYFEAGEDSIRFGFGDMDALKLLNENQNKIMVQMVERIRLSILIVDNNCLIFSPSIAQLDADSDFTEFPNGVYGDRLTVEKILNEFPSYNLELPSTTEEISNPFEEAKNIETLHKASVSKKLKDTLSNLEQYPPIDRLKLKKVNFYKNNFKILKRQVFGVKVKNKRINLNTFIKLLGFRNERLLSSWNIFSNSDIKQFQDMSFFQEELQLVDNEYLYDIGRFGSLIETQKIKGYEEKIKKLKEDFVVFMKESVNKDNSFFKYKESASQNKSYGRILKGSRDELIKYLISISIDDNFFFNYIMNEDRLLNQEYEDGIKSKKQIFEEYIKNFVYNKLKFPTEEDLIEKIDVKLDFYDISDELINNNRDFNQIIEKYGLNELRDYQEGFKLL
ncbi:hypothetical protein [Fredinandcohnia sp. FSL W7-1320]|uniref:hypothetical protein n=1 Tax=Fredinandcohnia sp. FSL W7-1320 TaxID=2954540 RepID=UPI0030FDC7D6